MNEIKKIKITGHSGYTSVLDAYKDKLIITPQYLRFKHIPYKSDDPQFQTSPENEMYSWKYKSNQQSYKDFFKQVSKLIQQYVRSVVDFPEVLDLGMVDYEIQYSDGADEKFQWPNGSYLNEEICAIIREYAPLAHPIPNLLRLNTDWEDENEFEVEDEEIDD